MCGGHNTNFIITLLHLTLSIAGNNIGRKVVNYASIFIVTSPSI